MNQVLLWLAIALLASSALAEQFSYSSFTLPTTLVTLGTAQVNGTALVLTPSLSNMAGLAYYPTTISANRGFSTNFTWIPESCDSTFGGGDGFAFFLTKDAPISQQVASSSGNSFGIRYVPNTYMIGYSAFAAQMYICDWTTPFSDEWRYSSSCTLYNVDKTTCGGRMNMKIDFDGSQLTVYNNNVVLASVAKSLDLDYYFVGLSGSTGQSFFKQSITQWAFTSLQTYFAQYEYAPSTADYLQFFGTANIVDGRLRLTTGGSEAGLVLTGAVYAVGFGFRTSFTWSPTNCDTEYNGADGFSVVLIPSPPTNETVAQSGGSGLGVQYLHYITMVAYSATFNEFYICNWTDPRPDLFRYVCETVVNPQPKYTCGSNYSIEVKYAGNVMSMSVDGQLKISTTSVTLKTDNYYFVGLSGATGGGYFQQDISDWSFKSNYLSNHHLWLPSSSNWIAVGSSSLDPVAQLTNGSNQAGALYYPGWSFIGYKFESQFTWTGYTCGSLPGARGFAHYISHLKPTASQVQSATPDELGIGDVADVYMIGYDLQAKRLFICDWGTPPTGLNPSVCSSVSVPTYMCGAAMNFKLTYDGFSMKLYLNGTFRVARTVSIYPRYYYVGFSGTTTNAFLTQQITDFAFSYVQLPPKSVTGYGFGYPGTPNPLLFGSARVEGNELVLTNDFYSDQNAGLMLHPQPLSMTYGFTSYVYWNATNCDSVYNGGNGFAFVMTKSIPSNSTVLASSGNGLGIQQVPDVIMFGYSSTYNEFYSCSWTTPLQSLRNNPACQTISNSAVNPVHPQRYTCNEIGYQYLVLNYDGHSLQFIFSGTEIPVYPAFPVDFSSSYYIGASGSIGDGYFRQASLYFALEAF